MYDAGQATDRRDAFQQAASTLSQGPLTFVFVVMVLVAIAATHGGIMKRFLTTEEYEELATTPAFPKWAYAKA